MHQSIKTTGLAAACLLFLPTFAAAFQYTQETERSPYEGMLVSVAATTQAIPAPLDGELSIWVGEIETQDGRPALWVELIDTYGEVIYEAEIFPNETHLLPDGRAVVVRSDDPSTRVLKTETARLESDLPRTVSRRVIQEGVNATSIEFLDTNDEAPQESALLKAARFGESLWASVMSFFTSTANRVQVAWNWIFETRRA